MTLLLGSLLLAGLAAAWVVFPILFRQWGLMTDAVPAATLDREARKRVALAALKDVEYDHAAGKLDDADYAEMRGRLELEALNALKATEPTVRGEAEGETAGGRHACGFVNPAGSRFCSGCGKPLR